MNSTSSSPAALLLLAFAALPLFGQSQEVVLGTPKVDPRIAASVYGPAFLEQHRCMNCHDLGSPTTESPKGTPASPLRDLSQRLSPAGLRRRLEWSHAETTLGGPPNLFAWTPEPERQQILNELVAFLTMGRPEVRVESVTVPLRDVEEGKRLYHALGCVACHDARPPESSTDSPFGGIRLEGAPQRPRLLPVRVRAGDTSHATLSKFLRNASTKENPSEIPHFPLAPGEAHAVAAFLLHDPADGASLQVSEGVAYRLWTGRLTEAFPSTKGLKLQREGRLPNVVLPPAPDNHFLVEYEADLLISEEGEYTFFLGSDDGSRLWLNGELLIMNDGIHPYQEKRGRAFLTEGFHALRVAYFEAEGESSLQLLWATEGGAKSRIGNDRFFQRSVKLPGSPPMNALAKSGSAQQGAKWAAILHCDRCHTDVPPPEVERKTTPFPDLDLSQGCLSGGTQTPIPRYALDEFDQVILKGLLSDPAAALGPQSDEIELKRELWKHRCVACHERDGFGGVPSELRDHFTLAVGQDLGDQDATPPSLTGVGRKLEAPWMARVLKGEARAHHHLKVRMPVYREDATRSLVTHLLSEDRAQESDHARLPAPPANFQDGPELLGIRGLGCIRCHSLLGRPSLGLAGVDLAEVTDRIRYSWFQEFLLDPNSVLPTTRMPNFFENGKSTAVHIAGGEPRAQIDALWHTLLLKEAMPLPEGLITDDLQYELTPRLEPLEVAVFMKGVSARTLLVGHKDGVHYAFDLQRGLLARAWKGRFFNARGTWDQRAGQLEEIPESHATSWSRAPNLASLSSEKDPWPKFEDQDQSVKVRGRSYDASGLPTFQMEHRGIAFHDHFQPIRIGNEWGLRWTRTLPTPVPTESKRKLLWRVASGQLQKQTRDEIIFPGLRIMTTEATTVHVIERQGGQMDVLIEMPLEGAHSMLKVDLLW